MQYVLGPGALGSSEYHLEKLTQSYAWHRLFNGSVTKEALQLQQNHITCEIASTVTKSYQECNDNLEKRFRRCKEIFENLGLPKDHNSDLLLGKVTLTEDYCEPLKIKFNSAQEGLAKLIISINKNLHDYGYHHPDSTRQDAKIRIYELLRETTAKLFQKKESPERLATYLQERIKCEQDLARRDSFMGSALANSLENSLNSTKKITQQLCAKVTSTDEFELLLNNIQAAISTYQIGRQGYYIRK